jgi:Uma2 family endonuclease
MSVYDHPDDKAAQVSEPDLSGTYTAADYMSWTFDGLVELIRGKIFKMSPAPSTQHQVVLRNLNRHFDQLFTGSPCISLFAPLDVYLVKPDEEADKTNNIVQPDLLVVCDKTKIKSFGCVGAPDLVVEIISPHTSKKDLTLKYTLYEEYGVREYWTVYPQEKIIHIFILSDGHYAAPKIYTQDETAVSTIFPDLQIPLDGVFNV